jgi:membrane associated rhomboid family serine protease
MRRDDSPELGSSLPRPGKGLKAALLTLFSIWLAFAVGINWGGASADLFVMLCGSTARIAHGEIWRLLTAPLMHHPQSLGSILFMLLGLYFLSPSLESAWGTKRFLNFLLLSAIGAYALQVAAALVLPASIEHKLVPEYWFGALPAVEAVAIAWALSFKGQTVRLMLLVPVSSRTLVLFVVGTSVLAVVALSELPSGLLAPFGGMLAGWLLGGGTPSPLRRWWLRQKLVATRRELQRERERERRRGRIATSGLRVIEGGVDAADDEPADQSAPASHDDRGGGDGRGPDGRLLN